MAANLVHRYQPPEAHHLLNLSFAQFQADKAVVRFEARIERQEERLAALELDARLRARGRRRVPGARAGRAGRQRPHRRRAGCGRLLAGPPVAGRRRRHRPAAGGRAVGGPPQGRRPAAEGHRRRRRAGHVHDRRPAGAARAPRAPRPAAAVPAQQPGLPAQGGRRAAPVAAGRARSRLDAWGHRRSRSTAGPVAGGGPPRRRLPRPRPPRARPRPDGAGPARAGGHAPGGAVPHRLAGPAVRPRPAAHGGVGLPRRVGPHRARARCWPAPTTSPTCWSRRR